MEYEIDPDNPLINSTGNIPPVRPEMEVDDFDIIQRMEIVRVLVPIYKKDTADLVDAAEELYNWVYALSDDEIEFRPDGDTSEG